MASPPDIRRRDPMKGSFGAHFNPPPSASKQDFQFSHISFDDEPPISMDGLTKSNDHQTSKRKKKRKRHRKEKDHDSFRQNGNTSTYTSGHSENNINATLTPLPTSHSSMNVNISNLECVPNDPNSTPVTPLMSPNSTDETQKKQKKTKMKKSKRHRKRHILPGPAGVLQMTSNSSLLSKSNYKTKLESKNDMTEDHQQPLDNQSQTQQLTSASSMEHQPIPAIIATIVHIQDHPAWKSMCVALSRYTPHFSHQHFLPTTNNNPTTIHSSCIRSNNIPVTAHLSKYLRKSIGPEYATVYEIHAGKHDCIVHPLLAVFISDLFLHSHCDYTCELIDESGMRIQGWLHERFVKERQQDIMRIGTVLLLKNASLTVFRKGDDGDDYFYDADIENGAHYDSTISAQDGNEMQVNTSTDHNSSLERMLLIGEETVICWWKASDAVNITYEEEIKLMKERHEMCEKLMQENIQEQKQTKVENVPLKKSVNSGGKQFNIGKAKICENVPSKTQTLNTQLSNETEMIDLSGTRDNKSKTLSTDIKSLLDKSSDGHQSVAIKDSPKMSSTFNSGNATTVQNNFSIQKSYQRISSQKTKNVVAQHHQNKFHENQNKETKHTIIQSCPKSESNNHQSPKQETMPSSIPNFNPPSTQQQKCYNPYKKTVHGQKTKQSQSTYQNKDPPRSALDLEGINKSPHIFRNDFVSDAGDKNSTLSSAQCSPRYHVNYLSIKQRKVSASITSNLSKKLSQDATSPSHDHVKNSTDDSRTKSGLSSTENNVDKINEIGSHDSRCDGSSKISLQTHNRNEEERSIWNNFEYDIQNDFLEEDDSHCTTMEGQGSKISSTHSNMNSTKIISAKSNEDKVNYDITEKSQSQSVSLIEKTEGYHDASFQKQTKSTSLFQNASMFTDVDFGDDDFED